MSVVGPGAGSGWELGCVARLGSLRQRVGHVAAGWLTAVRPLGRDWPLGAAHHLLGASLV